MKVHLLGLTTALVPVGARLHHVPIGRRGMISEGTHRILLADEDVDQDNLYQARNSQGLTINGTPWQGVLYGMFTIGLILFIAVFVFYCYGRSKGELTSSPSKASFWTSPSIKHAYLLSWISLLVTFFAIVAGITLYVSTGSSLFLVLGLENVVDFLSSAAVLWRFFAPSSIVTKETEAKLDAREQRASVAISMILVILGVATLITAICDLSRGQEDSPSEQQQTAALAISLVSFFLFGVLTVIKFRYAKAFQSPSLYKDGICSTVGTILSFSLFVNTLIIVGTPAAWVIDPVVAVLCGLVALVYGNWTLYTASRKDGGLPIFSLQWWFLSHQANNNNGQEAGVVVEPVESGEPKIPNGEHA